MTDLLLWSRLQFALTACVHWLFVPLTLGLAVVMGVVETMYCRTGDEFWKKAARYWQKLFGINFAVGVATGIILEFEFGTNWSNYSWFVGDIFGAPLAIEGILAFFMEATFIAVMFFGWDKVGRKAHLAATWLTGLGATISAWWILVANAWMQHPVGMTFNPDTVRNEMMDFFAVAGSWTAVVKFFHAVSSGWMTGAVFVIGVSCWYLIKKRHVEMAKKSIVVASFVGLAGAALCMVSGDQSGVDIAQNQPMKLAAAEGLERGENGAPFSIVPGVEVPKVLSILATHDINGYVPGIEDLKEEGATRIADGKQALAAFKKYRSKDATPEEKEVALAEFNARKANFGYGYLDSAEELVPPVNICFWTFRLMIGLGCFVMLVFLLSLWFAYKKQLDKFRWYHILAIVACPCVWIAGQCGWILAEVGRQPWAIGELLPVKAGVSEVGVGSVITTTLIFVVLFTILLIAEFKIMTKAIDQGPEE